MMLRCTVPYMCMYTEGLQWAEALEIAMSSQQNAKSIILIHIKSDVY